MKNWFPPLCAVQGVLHEEHMMCVCPFFMCHGILISVLCIANGSCLHRLKVISSTKSQNEEASVSKCLRLKMLLKVIYCCLYISASFLILFSLVR